MQSLPRNNTLSFLSSLRGTSTPFRDFPNFHSTHILSYRNEIVTKQFAFLTGNGCVVTLAQQRKYGKFQNSAISKKGSICFQWRHFSKSTDKHSSGISDNREETLDVHSDASRRGDHANKTYKLCVMFTGQGSQYVGMSHHLFHHHNSKYQHVVSPLIHVLKNHFTDLESMLRVPNDGTQICKDIEKELTLTSNAQPAILFHSFVLWRCFLSRLKKTRENARIFIDQETQNQFDIEYVFGHSLGEYTAILSSLVSDSSNDVASMECLQKMLHLVKERGRLMQNVCDSAGDEYAMAALMPCNEEKAVKILQQLELPEGVICNVANINSDQQVVLSGHKSAIQQAIQIAKKSYSVRLAAPLNVSAPFHSDIMRPVSHLLHTNIEDTIRDIAHLKNQTLQNPFPIPLISNLTGLPVTSIGEMIPLLKDHIFSPVRWYDSSRYCVEHLENYRSAEKNQQTMLVEIGPKNILTTLANRSSYMSSDGSVVKKPDSVHFIGTVEDVDKVFRDLA